MALVDGIAPSSCQGPPEEDVHDLQDRHIHVDIRKGLQLLVDGLQATLGCIRIDDAKLALAPLALLLEGLLPAGWEVTEVSPQLPRLSREALKFTWVFRPGMRTRASTFPWSSKTAHVVDVKVVPDKRLGRPFSAQTPFERAASVAHELQY
eukprot:CAMPEP_0171094438 /NCGR_PEP_ID=MMETSP0766_2-20121228/41149_1 /TAXON_ID=439317 /ORGANISM="Gambierdiscus australes, Strain CAWD 149" /LENGTH=150 /DNA_ID=CAMNT_0011553083 /DNA_START=40 /DNA_END=490 /DNA_ORIENTATION=+